MKKSELRTLIREILEEELTKASLGSRTQICEDQDHTPANNKYLDKARSWSADSLASDIYRNPAFKKAFEDDGWVLGDKVCDLVEKEVGKYFLNRKPEENKKNIDQVLAALDHYTAKENKDSDFYDWRKDVDTDKIIKDTHDKSGNAY